MTSSAIESVKSELNLAVLTKNELEGRIDQLNETHKLIKNSLDRAFTIYQSVMGTDAQQAGYENANEVLKEIDNSNGLKLFNFLFGFHESHAFITNNDKILLDKVINVISIIDKYPSSPSLPWPKVNGFLLFDKETETRIRKLGNHNIKQEDFYARIKVFNSLEDIVISNLQLPSYNTRMNDIFKLFINLKIAECIGMKPTIEYIDLRDQNKKFNKTTNTKFIKHNGNKVDLNKYVSSLFKEIFELTKEKFDKENVIHKNVTEDDPLWEKLLNKVITIKSELNTIRNEYREILDVFDSDSETNKIFIEIRKFITDNKTKNESDENSMDERFLPDRKVIERIKGGKGLMKKISTTEGGIASVKRKYPIWVANKIKKEISTMSLKPRDINKEKYDERNSSTCPTYDGRDLTLKTKQDMNKQE